MLCRLYDPSSGFVQVGSHDLRQLDLQAWRSQLGAVFQDFGRYDLTVAENIALGHGGAALSQSLLEDAAAKAGFASHAELLRNGYATQLGGQCAGVDLSVGQWQTLAMARAFVRPHQVLILDEPTAALDPRAEYELFKRFRALAAGKTTFLITHRLASVQMADQIVVLKQGRVVEQGTHQQLLAAAGEYAELYRLQSEQFPLL